MDVFYSEILKITFPITLMKIYKVSNNRFKRNIIRISFYTEATVFNMTSRALLAEMMEMGSKKYPSTQKLSLKLDELYGAELSLSNVLSGRDSKFTVQITFTEPKLVNDEQLTQSIVNFLNEIIRNPDFADKNLFLSKNNLHNEYLSTLDDKMTLAFQQVKNSYFKDPIFFTPWQGNQDLLANVSLDDLKNEHSAMISTDNLTVEYFGNDNIDKLFSDWEPTTAHLKENYLQNPTNPNKVEQKSEVEQTKFVQLYQWNSSITNQKQWLVSRIFNVIFSETPDSLLFKNVREKLSLAYSIYSVIDSTTSTFYVLAGIEAKNVGTLQEAVKNQLAELIKNIDTSAWQNAVNYTMNRLKIQEDKPSFILKQASDKDRFGYVMDYESSIKLLDSISIQDIQEFVSKLILQETFILHP